MLTILLGILSSTAAEVVTALNKKLQGTLLQGDAAFLIAFGMALPAAFLKEVLTPGFAWSDFFNLAKVGTDFAEIFAISQVYFLFVVQKLNLDIGPSNAVVTTTTTVAPTAPSPTASI